MGENARTRRMTIVAQDPGIQDPTKTPHPRSSMRRSVLMATVDVPAEELSPGPRGHRVYVIDYDSSNDHFYEPFDFEKHCEDRGNLPYEPYRLGKILSDPGFHAMNVYAIVMRTLARFEFALGRRVPWRVDGHQLKVLPHGFADANAFYTPDAESIVFGYFRGRDSMIYSCLSHDVIVHETTHALLDGLRGRFTDPSSSDQAAFHEGLADVVALLSVLSLREVVGGVLDYKLDAPEPDHGDDSGSPQIREFTVESGETGSQRMIHKEALTADSLTNSILLGLAEQMGQELGNARGTALRRSASLTPSPDLLKSDKYQEPHRRGEILSAAILHTFLEVWLNRIDELKPTGEMYDRATVAREGAEAADYLLTMAIRALDYTPPVHLKFRDYLSAMLTADAEVRSDDSKYEFRKHLKNAFRAFGIKPPPNDTDETGVWRREEARLRYDRTRFESMQSSPDEVFKWVWDNRKALGMIDAYTVIESIRPSTRVAPEDGFTVRETVVECVQHIELRAGELERDFGLDIPDELPTDTKVRLKGGATLIFDDYGRLKFKIPNLLPNPDAERLQRRSRRNEEEQRLVDAHERSVELYDARVQSLLDHGEFVPDRQAEEHTDQSLVQREGKRRFRDLHLSRALDSRRYSNEVW